MNYREELDYSSLSETLLCPRRFYFRHIRHLVKDSGSNIDLLFGLCAHAGQESSFKLLKAQPETPIIKLIQASEQGILACWDKKGGEAFNGIDTFPKSKSRAIDLCAEFWIRNFSELLAWEIIGTEVSFAIPLGQGLPTYIGRMDAVLRHRIKKQLLQINEYKTTKSASDIWFAGFENNIQTEGYLTAGKLFYDLVPTVKVYGLVTQKTKIDLVSYPITRTDHSTDRTLDDLRTLALDILVQLQILEAFREQSEAQNPHAIMPCFRRRPGMSCTAWMRRCPYMDLCMCRNNPDSWIEPPQGYVISEWNPRDHYND